MLKSMYFSYAGEKRHQQSHGPLPAHTLNSAVSIYGNVGWSVTGKTERCGAGKKAMTSAMLGNITKNSLDKNLTYKSWKKEEKVQVRKPWSHERQGPIPILLWTTVSACSQTEVVQVRKSWPQQSWSITHSLQWSKRQRHGNRQKWCKYIQKPWP